MYKEEHVPSPCNNNCIINFDTKLCKGCFRTIDEIISWSTVSNEEKRKILELVDYRKEANTSSA